MQNGLLCTLAEGLVDDRLPESDKAKSEDNVERAYKKLPVMRLEVGQVDP